MRIAAAYGLMTGLLIASWMLIEYLFGFHNSPVGRFSGYASFIFAIAGIYFGMKSYRKNVGAGFISFERAAFVGILISSYAALVTSIFTYFYYTTINPSFAEFIIDKHVAKMESQNATPQQIEDQMHLLTETYQAWPQAYYGFAGFLLIGTFMSLAFAIFMRRQREEEESLSETSL